MFFLPSVVTANEVTPVQKVITLLNNMVEKGKAEKQAEQVQFASFKTFCDGTIAEKQAAIAATTEEITTLTAEVEKYEADAAEAAREVASLDADISTWEGDTKAAVKVREIERADYTATHKDYSETLTALEMAIATLMKTSADVKQAAAALTQLSDAPLFPVDSKKVLSAFIEKADEALAAPEANAYEFQSKAIVDMLSKLAGKFDDERTSLEQEETNAQHSFEMLKTDLANQLEVAEKAREANAEAKAKALQGAADSKGALQDAVTTRDDDEKYTADLTATCEQKSTDFANRQQLRSEEITAIEKATEVLAGGAVSGASETHLPQLLQQKKTSLAQLRAEPKSPNQQKVAAYLTRRSHELNSRVLSAMALRVQADPFKKVKKLVKDLIVKLMEEANEEVEQKGYCDKELASNKETRKEKSEAVMMLTAEIDELTASIKSLSEDIADLTAAISELDAAVAKATEVRTAENSKNTVTIADAQAAQTAVASALGILNEFYTKAAEATSLAQTSAKVKAAQPEIFSDKPYTGMTGESGGVLGMIEVIESDFARLEAETTASESEAAKQYEEFMQDSKVDKTQKSADLDHKSGLKQNQEQALVSTKSDLAGTQKELDAAMAYYEKLKPTCVSSGDSYEDRVAKRKEEIESLQEALRILNGEDVA